MAVGASRDELDPVEPAVEWGGVEEAADLGAALEALRLGRHREERVVGEERDDAVEVDRRPGLLEAPHDPLLLCRVRGHVFAREVALVPLALEAVAAALQRAVDGRHAVVEQLGHLPRRPVEDVA